MKVLYTNIIMVIKNDCNQFLFVAHLEKPGQRLVTRVGNLHEIHSHVSMLLPRQERVFFHFADPQLSLLETQARAIELQQYMTK